MIAAITPHVQKPRKRPSIRGHKGIERGSADAARLFWQDADVIGQAAGLDGFAELPKVSRYGFESTPTPPDDASHEVMRAWYRRERERHHASSLRMSPEDRAMIYWGAVDHRSMWGASAPDPYIFGYTTFPERPADRPEPDYVREIRELRAGVASMPVGEALSAFGLTSAATAQDVQRAYGRIVREQKMHPDHGGNQAAFVRFTAMRDRALALVTPAATEDP